MTGARAVGRRIADDPEAFRACYESLGPLVVAYLRRRVPREEVEDVRQQVFLDVWRSRERYDPALPLEPWVLTIAKRRAVDHVRRTIRTPDATEYTERDDVGTPSDFADAHADADELRAALTTLSEDQREALELAYFEHLTQTQIADKLGVPLGTVKARTARALRKLARTLVPDVNEEET